MHCACSTFEECSNSKKYAETFTFAQRILDVHDNRVWIQMIIVYEYSQRKLSERSSVQKYHEIASCVCRRSTCAQCCNSKCYVENFTFALRIRNIHDQVYEYIHRKHSVRSCARNYHVIASRILLCSTFEQCCNSKYYVQTSCLRCGFLTFMAIGYEYSQRKLCVRSCVRKYHEIS